MGSLEKTSARRARRGQLERTALTALATVGMAGIAIAAPNALQLLRKFDPTWIDRSPTRRLRSVANQLYRKGYIEWVSDERKKRMRITEKGKRHLDSAVLSGKRLPRPKRWDGKWRLVVFDIKESRRPTRNKVRSIVRNFGFELLQQSIWVYPYDCEEVIALLKNELKLGRELLYIIADAIEHDKPLRQRFGLPIE